MHIRRRDYEEAVRQAEMMVEMQPDDPWSRVQLAWMLVRAGRVPEAETYVVEAKRLAPDSPAIQLFAALASAAAGDGARALATVDTLLAAEGTLEAPGIEGILALIYGELGLRDEAMHWLTEARRKHDTIILFLDSEEFDSLRADDRFATLIRELDLPEDVYLRPLS